MPTTIQPALILTITSFFLASCSGDETNTQASAVQTAAASSDEANIPGAGALDLPGDSFTDNAPQENTGNNDDNRRNDPVTTRSPQGIDGDGNRRRQNARNRVDNQTQATPQGREVRTYNGSGNNQSNHDWGASFSQLQRIAPAGYADGVSTLAGESRENARYISTALAAQGAGENIPNTFGTSDYVWQWGQFLDHDINLTDGSDFESADIVVPVGDFWFDPSGTGLV